jgi:aldose 1-epimerase
MKLGPRACIFLMTFFVLLPASLAAANYSVTKETVDGYTTYHLHDASRKMEVAIAPGLGNFVYQFTADGKNVLIPAPSLKTYFQDHKFCCGIPFLAPWANRIDHEYYWFQNKKYLLNSTLGNILHTPPYNLPIHGTVVFNPQWQVIHSGATEATGAYITSRLEYYKYPDLMAQFPFALTYQVTYRLKDGKLENTTEVANVSARALPVYFGYHPYLRPDGPREDWTVSIEARKHWKVDNHKRLIPTGETEPADRFLPHASDFTLGKKFLDDAFSGLERDSRGLGHYWVKGKTEKVELVFGKEFNFGHVYAPLGQTLICMEPETAVTNAFNLNHAGKFPELIVLEPGKTFKASFWIVPSGY